MKPLSLLTATAALIAATFDIIILNGFGNFFNLVF